MRTASCHSTCCFSSVGRARTPKIVQPLRRVPQPVRCNPLTYFAFGACGWLVRISLVRSERDSNAPLEKFRHKTTILILLRGLTRQSLGKRRQRAHRRRFARPPRILNRAGLSAVKTSSRPRNQAADFAEHGKVLNLCIDSKRRTAVTFSTAAQNKFINCLRRDKAERNFRTTLHHYADK